MNSLEERKRNNTMRTLLGAIFLCTLLLATSCSVRRFLPAGERLYSGSTIKVEKDSATSGSKKSLQKTLKLAVTPKANKFLLGQPYKVWWWYKIGEPKKEKGLKAFLRKKLGEPPVLSSRVNAKVSAENMQSLMENLGYFHTTVQGDTNHVGSYFVKANYIAKVKPQYTLAKIEWVGDSSALFKTLQNNSKKNGLLKVGNPYRLSDITTERDRLDLFLKTKGYYFFNPDYLMAYADSSVGNRKVNLYLNIKKTTPDEAKYSYKINDITVYPSYSLTSANMDTSKNNFVLFDKLKINDPEKKFKPVLFENTITFRPGSIYNSRQQNSTLNRFIGLGAFKFVKNRFEAVNDSNKIDTAHLLNVYYYLTPAKKKSIQAQIDGATKENNFIGSQLSVNWKNRNAFKGAEQLAAKLYGGFETSTSREVRINNLRLGTEVSLSIPKYAIPFFTIKENNFYPPKTTLLLGYEWFKKDIFFIKNLFRFQYEFTWKPNLQKQFTVAPVAVSYLQATNVTDSFKKEIAVNPSLLLSVYSEAVLGTFASYTRTSSFRARRNKTYFKASIELSGNIAGLATGAKEYRSKNIFGVPFAQYVKLDVDYHFTRKMVNNIEWANRLQVGIGLPYNNSKLLPFTKLYTIGGSGSIRGFRTRTLGPGTYKPTPDDQRFFQIIGGDYKLLGNTELRLPFTKQLSGAVFVDAGNVWTKDTTLFGIQGQLNKNFLKELAIAAGIGIRFDATVLLIRVDLGMPVRKPYLPDGERWVLNKIDIASAAWRKENLIVNIAIGLPF
jgi:outer membrane protein insertion porin family